MADLQAKKSASAASLDYTQLANTYTTRYIQMLDQYNKLIDVAKIKQGESVLDVGCGTGMVGYLVTERGLAEPWQVCFGDENKAMITQAKRALKDKFGDQPAGVPDRFIRFDFNNEAQRTEAKRKFGHARGFDVVLAHLVLGCFTNSSKHHALEALLDLTAPGGRVVFDYPAPSPSADVGGRPESDEMVWGFRRVPVYTDAIRRPFKYVSGRLNPIVEGAKCAVTDREAAWMSGKLSDMVGLAKATVMEKEEIYPRQGIKNVGDGWWDEIVAGEEEKMKMKLKKKKNKKETKAGAIGAEQMTAEEVLDKQMSDVDKKRRVWATESSRAMTASNPKDVETTGKATFRIVFSLAVVVVRGAAKR